MATPWWKRLGSPIGRRGPGNRARPKYKQRSGTRHEVKNLRQLAKQNPDRSPQFDAAPAADNGR
jgi:hypothetical protein